MCSSPVKITTYQNKENNTIKYFNYLCSACLQFGHKTNNTNLFETYQHGLCNVTKKKRLICDLCRWYQFCMHYQGKINDHLDTNRLNLDEKLFIEITEYFKNKSCAMGCGNNPEMFSYGVEVCISCMKILHSWMNENSIVSAVSSKRKNLSKANHLMNTIDNQKFNITPKLKQLLEIKKKNDELF